MFKTKFLIPVFASSLLLVACGQESAAPVEAPLDLASVEAKVSYALAFSYLDQLEQGGVQVDREAFIAGANDRLSGNARVLSDEEIQLAFQTLQTRLQEEAMVEMAAMSEEALAEAEAFLAANAALEGIQSTDSRLQYRVIQSGDGESPTTEDTVRVHYTGRLLDGTVFDSSVERGEPAEFGVTQVIPAWVEALQLMKVGDKVELFIHPDLGYGVSGAGGLIGPNELLIFEVELLEIVR